MRLAIVGAGAIGCSIGGHLARAGHEVTLICRGAHLAAIRARGLKLKTHDGSEFVTHPAATDRPEEVGRQDGVILTAKAYSLAELAPRLAGMLGPTTPVVSTQNGVQWWYLAGTDASGPFETVDPGGSMWTHVGPGRAVGGAAMIICIVREPGVVYHAGDPRLALGPIDGAGGSHAGFCADLAGTLTAAGITATAGDGRAIMWTKLRGYIGTGPLATLTQTAPGTLRQIPGMPEFQARLAGEVEATARAWGVELPPVAQVHRPPQTGNTGMPSMWQDFEAGKPLELDAIVQAPIELGQKRGLEMGATASLLALLRAKLLWRERQAAAEVQKAS